MEMTKESPRRGLSANLETLRDRIGKGLGSASDVLPLSEAEQKLLFRVMPDQVLRIYLERDGFVSVVGQRTRIRVSAKAAAHPDDQPGGENQPVDPMKVLYEELGRHGERLMAEFLKTGEVQILELQLDHDGQTAFHEVRAAACKPKELLAVVRDVTSIRDAENAILRSTDELTHLNEVLESEASLRAEEEAVLKNSFRKLRNLLQDTIEAVALIVKKTVDTVAHIVHGQVNSLSWFFIGGEWVWIGDGNSAPTFPSIYIGIGAALGVGILAYFVRRRTATR